MITAQETNVAMAFSKQAPNFDVEDIENPVLQWMRNEIRESALQYFHPGSTLLELNCGTGMDAIFFAEKGFRVLATDNATGMLAELEAKIRNENLSPVIKTRNCSFNNLEQLHPQTFDGIFSNFGGLNCAEDLASVIYSMDELLKPGGIATLVIMPAICPWEILSVLKGNFKKAGRRFNKKGAVTHLEGFTFRTWYYSPAYVKKAFGENYKIVGLKAIGTLIPPPQSSHLAIKYPRLFNTLKKAEKRVSHLWPFYTMADHFLISLKKTRP